MKNIISLAVFLLFFPVCTHAHPGKTDYKGGHKCRKNCSEWELFRGEYHLHDKDWNPIRLDKYGNPLKQVRSEPLPEPEPVEEMPAPIPPEQKPQEIKKPYIKTVNVQSYNVTVYEESILPFGTLSLLILAVLLLIALIFVRKKKETGGDLKK
ncbi:MAG: hypothetical protein HY754_04740 [Nitrospirae bacterium]|nr:hypothetical protein [Nitrospirota bacterium]